MKKYGNNNLLCLLAITAFALILYFPVIFSDKTISSFDLCYFRDTAFERFRPSYLDRPSNPLLTDPVNQFQPWDKAMMEGVLSFPWLWNPYNGCGSPLLANSQSAVFFPLKYIGYLFGVNKGFGYVCFLKTLFAGIFMCMYLRTLQLSVCARITGSIGFMVCGFMIVWLQYPLASAAMFLPLLFMGAELAFSGRFRNALLALAGGTALSFLGGHPETTVKCLTGTALYSLGIAAIHWQSLPKQKFWLQYLRLLTVPLVAIACSIVLGTLIAAVQVLPAAEYILNSYTLSFRLAGQDSVSSGFALSLHHIIELYRNALFYLVPNTFGNPSLHDQWWWGDPLKYHNTGYIGAGLLFMACVAPALFRTHKKIIPLLIVQIISLGFIAELPFVQSTIGKVPPFNVAENSRFVLLFSFSAAALGAIVFDHFWNGRAISRFGRVWYMILPLIFSIVVLSDFFMRFAFTGEHWMVTYGLKSMLHFFVFFIPWVLIFGIYRLSYSMKRLAGAFLIGMLAFDLYLVHSLYNPTIAADEIYFEPQTVKNIREHIQDSRIIPVFLFRPCMGLVYQLNDPRVYDAVDIAWYAQYLQHTGYIFPLHEILPDFSHRFASIASMQYVWIPAGIASSTIVRYNKIFSDESGVLYENPDSLPRAYVATAWQSVVSNEEAFRVLNEEAFPWRNRAVLEPGKDSRRFITAAHDTGEYIPAAIISERDHQLDIQLPVGTQGLLVLNDTFYPGWQAYIDGRTVPIYRVNGAFRGVFVDTADTMVRFYYRPASFAAGVIISCLCFGILIVLLLAKLNCRVCRWYAEHVSSTTRINEAKKENFQLIPPL